MHRFRFAPALAGVVFALGLVACGDSGDGHSEETRALERTPPPEARAREAVPEVTPEPVARGIEIRPAGDSTGTVDTVVARPGTAVTVWVVADTEEGARAVNTTQFRLVVPNGVEVVHEDRVMKRVLTLGHWSQNFMMTFPCRGPGRFPLMRYELRIDDAFGGGDVRVEAGIPRRGAPFLGFASCDVPNRPEKVPATGGVLHLGTR